MRCQNQTCQVFTDLELVVLEKCLALMEITQFTLLPEILEDGAVEDEVAA